jgi:hypothetical protein
VQQVQSHVPQIQSLRHKFNTMLHKFKSHVPQIQVPCATNSKTHMPQIWFLAAARQPTWFAAKWVIYFSRAIRMHFPLYPAVHHQQQQGISHEESILSLIHSLCHTVRLHIILPTNKLTNKYTQFICFDILSINKLF